MGSGQSFKGAGFDRIYSGWNAQSYDVNDEIWLDGDTLSARAWDLYRNDPYAHAMVETVVGGILGPAGLVPRSLFQADEDPDTSDEERQVRRQIEACIRRATMRRRFDAGGTLTFREMCAAMIRGRFVGGNSWAVRVFKPGRPDAYQATCWRLIDAARVCNPFGCQNTPTLFQGVEMDGDGNPIAIQVESVHPNLMRQFGERKWTRIPIYGPDGSLNVVHYRSPARAEQILGVSEFSSNIQSLKYLSDVTQFWVVAKKMQAANAIIIECDDPVAAVRADRNGALLSGTVGIKPGMKYYVKTGWKTTFMNTNFQGADYKEFRNANLEAACAPWNLPYEFVLHSLTGANLSSSRAALLQFYTRMQQLQDELVAQVIQPWLDSILREEMAFGTIDFMGADFEMISRMRFIRPPRVWPDPLKEAQAAKAWLELKRSYSGVFGEAGIPFEEDMTQRAQDDAFMKAQGVAPLEPEEAPQPAPADANTPAADVTGDAPESAVEPVTTGADS
jgi:lambda family phage portal protein